MLELLVILVLVLLNGLLAGAEIALVTLRRTRVEQLAEERKGGARAVAELRANPERFLATVQVGITLLGAAAAVYGGDSLARRVGPVLAKVPALAPHAHPVSLLLVILLVTYLSVVLGELVPRSLALRATERYALAMGRPLLALAQVARPVVWFLTLSSNGVLRLFGDKTSFTEVRMSAEELKALLEEASQHGELDPRASEIASRALELGHLDAGDVMLPRHRIAALPKEATVEQLRELVREKGHSRVPIYDGSIDEVLGYVSVRDVYARGASSEVALGELLRPVLFIAETMKAVDVLPELQRRSAQLALVVDEHGAIAGLLTREDLMEELVGEVLGERSVTDERWVHAEDGVIVAGTALVREVNRAVGLNLPESDDWTTVSGMCVGLCGHIPAKGDRIPLAGGGEIEVLDAAPRRVRSVKVLARAPEEPESDES
jgi:putative hemolysin